MRLVWGARKIAVVAEKKAIDIIDAEGSSKRCEPDRDHASKAYSRSATHATLPYVALASRAGSVQIIDVRTGKTVHRFDVGEECSGLGFGARSLFVSTKSSGLVIEYDVETGKEETRFEADKDGISCLSVSQDGDDDAPLVATAREAISVWRAGKRVSRYAGHDKNVSCMVFLKGGALVSLAEHDRSVSVWPAQVKKAKHPVLILTSPEGLGSVCAGDRLLDGDEGAILAMSEAAADPKVFAWRIPSLSEDGKVATLQHVAVIASPSANEAILACDFGKVKGAVVLLLNSKSAVLPALAEASLLSEGGIAKTVTVRATEPSIAKDTSSNGAPSTASEAAKKPELKRLEVAALVNSGGAGDAKRARAASNVSGGEDERPMLARLSEFSHRLEESAAFSGVAPTQASRTSAPSSLSVALEQALQTEDKEKIEAVLQTTDPSIVSQTVQRLSPSKLPVLVRELAVRLQGKPGRAGLLLVWLNAVIEHHGATLASDPAARDALRHVYSVADARVQTFDRLLRLKGRLDVLLARSGSSSGAARASSKGPLLVIEGAGKAS